MMGSHAISKKLMALGAFVGVVSGCSLAPLSPMAPLAAFSPSAVQATEAKKGMTIVAVPKDRLEDYDKNIPVFEITMMEGRPCVYWVRDGKSQLEVVMMKVAYAGRFQAGSWLPAHYAIGRTGFIEEIFAKLNESPLSTLTGARDSLTGAELKANVARHVQLMQKPPASNPFSDSERTLLTRTATVLQGMLARNRD